MSERSAKTEIGSPSEQRRITLALAAAAWKAGGITITHAELLDFPAIGELQVRNSKGGLEVRWAPTTVANDRPAK